MHDGPEYDELAGLTAYLSSLIATGDLPPVRAALLGPGHRDERYSADGAYTRALCLAVLPRLRAEVATTAAVGVGASLGALAMLHAQRQNAGCLDALFLQSGSFFHPRHDAHERRFERYQRIVRSVDAVLRADGHPAPVPTVMTCGTLEENLANNRIMARALSAQGYDVTLREVRDVHSYTAWRDALDPWLTGLLREVARRDEPGPAGAAMTRTVELTSPISGWRGQVVTYGHWGAPVLVFPSEAGRAWDFENNGMVEAVRWLLDAGRLKLYCVDSADADTWSDTLAAAGGTRRPARLVRAVGAGAGGALHPRRLRRADADHHPGLQPRRLPRRQHRAPPRARVPPRPVPVRFLRPLAVARVGRTGRRQSYFHNPMDYVANLQGDHLEWLRRSVHLVLVVGQGSWEVDPTRALPSTLAFAEVLSAKGISHELDVWGHDVPHDWPSWQRQAAHHLPRLI